MESGLRRGRLDSVGLIGVFANKTNELPIASASLRAGHDADERGVRPRNIAIRQAPDDCVCAGHMQIAQAAHIVG